MDDKKIALLLLAIVALVAIAGFIALLKAKNTGEFTYAGSFMQLQPREACERIGCTFKEGFKMSTPYRELSGAPIVMCECPSGLASGEPREVLVPLVQRLGREY
ncbi:MAG: hypothetical protein QW666_03085 [Candidatus Woesearchaeota archaeon]